MNEIYRCSNDLVVREIVGETLIVPISGKLANMARIFSLNSTGVFIWKRLDGATPLRDIRDGLVKEFAIPDEQAQTDLIELVEDLLEAELIAKVA